MWSFCCFVWFCHDADDAGTAAVEIGGVFPPPSVPGQGDGLDPGEVVAPPGCQPVDAVSFAADDLCPLGPAFGADDVVMLFLYDPVRCAGQVFEGVFVVFQQCGTDDELPLCPVLGGVADPYGVPPEFTDLLDGGVPEVGFVAVVVTGKLEVHAAGAVEGEVGAGEDEVPGGRVDAIHALCFQGGSGKAVFVDAAEGGAVGGFEGGAVYLTNSEVLTSGGGFPCRPADPAVCEQNRTAY